MINCEVFVELRQQIRSSASLPTTRPLG